MNGRAQGGFTYLSLLFMITVLGIAAGAAGKYWSTEARRSSEEELLFRGMQIRAAIASYHDTSPGAKAYPGSLDELLLDKRHPVTRRHLRRLYTDPMTGKADWQLIEAPGGSGIMGVRSSSEKEPLKKKGFPDGLVGFEESGSYGQWEFVYTATAEGGKKDR